LHVFRSHRLRLGHASDIATARRRPFRLGRWGAALLLTTLLSSAGAVAGQEATPAPAAVAISADGCWTPEQRLPEPDASGARYAAAPTMVVDPAKGYVATLETSLGTFEVELFPAEAPLAVNNFVCLAADGFYDGTPFHRILQGFVIQGGDPTGTGSGGPGYQFADEPVGREYERGTLAMANAGPNTNGSQFFVVLDDLRERLPKNYTLFGRVSSGLEAVDAIAAVAVTTGPSGESSSPTEAVTLVRATVREAAPPAPPPPTPTPDPAQVGVPAGTLGELADRITTAFAGVTSYRTTTTFSTLPSGGAGTDPAATPAPLAEAGTIVDEVLIPDRRRRSTSADGTVTSEAISVGGTLYVKGMLASAAVAGADGATWLIVDPATIDQTSQDGQALATLLRPIESPFAGLPPEVRAFTVNALGPRTAAGQTCEAFRIAVPGGDGGGGAAELIVGLAPGDLPCWTETRTGLLSSLIAFDQYNQPLTIEAPEGV